MWSYSTAGFRRSLDTVSHRAPPTPYFLPGSALMSYLWSTGTGRKCSVAAAALHMPPPERRGRRRHLWRHGARDWRHLRVRPLLNCQRPDLSAWCSRPSRYIDRWPSEHHGICGRIMSERGYKQHLLCHFTQGSTRRVLIHTNHVYQPTYTNCSRRTT